MIGLASVPFLVAAVLYGYRPRQSRLPPPAATTWLLTILALTVSLTCGVVLCAAAVTAAAQLPLAGRLGDWSTGAVHRGGPPLLVGGVAAAVIVTLLAMATHRLAIALRAGRRARAAVGALSESNAALVIVADDLPTAYALGLIRGRVVVSTAMLAALSPAERRVLLAHEAAHLRHRHQAFVQLTELAAAANPLLRPLTGAVRASVERWADESAATAVGDRRLAAHGLARAALARARCPLPVALPIAQGDVTGRVQALLRPPVAARWPASCALAALSAACWLASLAIVIRTHQLIEVAERLR